MDYQPLARLFHKSTAPDRFGELDKMAHARREASSSFKTGVHTEHGELFVAAPRELSLLNEKVLRLERKVSATMRSLPPIAQASLVRGLVMDEVVCTNDLEGIHSTRRQIGELLDAIESRHEPQRRDRFIELTRLYLELSEPTHMRPSSPEDIRSIYDRIMLGELSEKDMPDGKLFRAHGVDIIGSGERVLHSGMEPEEKIISTLQAMLDFASSDDVPEMYGAIASHYIFEYVHPFYDGNGRTGRYLLALFLSEPLSLLTSLSLSRTIAEGRDSYYRAFKQAQDPLNRGELTFFVLDIMELIRKAQDDIIRDLDQKLRAMEQARSVLEEVVAEHGLGEKDAGIVFMLVQVGLFGVLQDSSLAEIARHVELGTQMTRKHLLSLEGKGLVATTKKRPLRFVLADRAAAKFGLNE